MHAQAFIHINLRMRTCAAHTLETHPPTTMLGFARDKQPGCEVCICRVSEWGIEMARRHRAAVQTDSAKAACPQIITSVFQRLRHLSTSQRLCALPAVVRASEKWAAELNLSFNGRHTQGGLTRQGWAVKGNDQFTSLLKRKTRMKRTM